MAKRGLGKGLDALIGTKAETAETVRPEKGEPGERLLFVAVDQILPNPHQVRRKYDEVAIAELAESIRSSGLLQPLVVTRSERGEFILVAGERRLRAARLAGLEQVPVRVIQATDERTLAILSLIENLHREDLDPVEEARGYRMMAEKFGFTQEAIAGAVCKSRPHVANAMRLLELPKPVLQHLIDGELTAGHARAVLKLPDEKDRLLLARKIIAKKLSVREAERLADRMLDEADGGGDATKPQKERPHPWLADQLRQQLSTKVEFKGTERSGRIVIHYYSEDDLTRIVELMKR